MEHKSASYLFIFFTRKLNETNSAAAAFFILTLLLNWDYSVLNCSPVLSTEFAIICQDELLPFLNSVGQVFRFQPPWRHSPPKHPNVNICSWRFGNVGCTLYLRISQRNFWLSTGGQHIKMFKLWWLYISPYWNTACLYLQTKLFNSFSQNIFYQSSK